MLHELKYELAHALHTLIESSLAYLTFCELQVYLFVRGVNFHKVLAYSRWYAEDLHYCHILVTVDRLL